MICQLSPSAALPLEPTKLPTIAWSITPCRPAMDVLQHRRPGNPPDGGTDGTFDYGAIELAGFRDDLGALTAKSLDHPAW
jgi:hypothetical protein